MMKHLISIKDSFKYLALAVVAVSMLALKAAGEPEIPSEGLKAEGEKRWTDAIAAYKTAISSDPLRADLWVRIAQIEAVRGQRQNALDAWRHASELSPENAALMFKLATSYSQVNKPKQALAVINKALKLAPRNLEYLRARAVYANWTGDVELTFKTYQSILELLPDNEEALVGLSSAASWLKGADSYSVVATALDKAAGIHPKNASLKFRTAQAYSLANEPFLAAISGGAVLRS